jgi:cytochrome d ubiquinol oxidase subunit I
MDALLLARLQFATTTSLHFLFVLLTLGLVTLLVYLQTAWLITRKPVYRRLTRFWGTLYVINYALGIATGIVMEFQFGLNWSGLSHYVGNVFGAPLAMETLLAFTLESTFLGMWIFGWHRLPAAVHTALLWLFGSWWPTRGCRTRSGTRNATASPT